MSEKVFVWLKPQFLGDAVMACPMIDSMIDANIQVVVRASPIVQQVLADRAAKVWFVTGGKISGLGAILKAAKELRAENPDAMLLVNRSFRSALAARFAGVPIRIGHATEGRGFLLTHRIPYDEARFEAECYLDLLEPLGIKRSVSLPSLTVTEEEKESACGLLGGATVGVQPGARYPEKQLPIQTLAEVASALQQKGLQIAMLGGPDEVEDAVKFQSLVGAPVVDLVGKCSIRQTLAVLSNLRLMIGSDTGLMHLAVAVGCPTVTVFGPNPISKWGHHYGPHYPTAAPEGKPSLVKAGEIVELALKSVGT
ncbi:MAG: glycosyltransferase family 9 protein [Fimbriimonadaceae bacterium]|nr:glycosyltransferase family 9 protein [Fimbriimonadaceae bacterium]